MKREEFKRLYQNAEPYRADPALIRRLKPLCDPEFTKGPDPVKTLSREEAAEDIGLFFDLLPLAYAGYPYFRERADFPGIRRKLTEGLGADGISSAELRSRIFGALKPVINDTHFAFDGAEPALRFYRPFLAYFAGLTVEKRGEDYLSCEGGELEAGTVIPAAELKDRLFPTLPAPDGSERWLVGILTDGKPESLAVGGRVLPLHRCRTDATEGIHGMGAESSAYSEWTWNGMPISVDTDFTDRGVHITREQLGGKGEPHRERGKGHAADPVLVWSLLGNSGGNSDYPMQFIEGLNGYANWETDCAILVSPLTDGGAEDGTVSWEVCKGQRTDPSRGKFSGRLFVLQNKGIASSGESALKYAASVKNAVFVGSATAGCGQFGDVRRFRLPNSGISFRMGFKVFNMDGFEEGKGFLPDYWVDLEGDEIYSVIEDYIKARGFDLPDGEWHAGMKKRIEEASKPFLDALNAYADKADEKKETLGRLASRIAEAVREL